VVVAEDFDIPTVRVLVVMAAAGHIVSATAHCNVKAAKVAKEDIDMGFVHMPAEFVMVRMPVDFVTVRMPADFVMVRMPADFVMVRMPAGFVTVHNSADSAEEHSLVDFEIAPDEVVESKSKLAVIVVGAEVMSMDIHYLRALKEILLVEEEQVGVACYRSSSSDDLDHFEVVLVRVSVCRLESN
jgi:hypothetical protein